MMKGALETLPEASQVAGADYLFVSTFLMRQASGAHLATAIACLYSLYQTEASRHGIHLMNLCIGAMMLYINLNHAGVPLGWQPFVSFHGQMVGIVFAPYWLVATYLHYKGFKSAKALSKGHSLF